MHISTLCGSDIIIGKSEITPEMRITIAGSGYDISTDGAMSLAHGLINEAKTLMQERSEWQRDMRKEKSKKVKKS